MDAILRLDEQNLKFCVESGEKLPDDAINSVIAAFGPLRICCCAILSAVSRWPGCCWRLV